jgi:hypothetical protein
MADKPTILLVFSNAEKDLNGVHVECKEVSRILVKAKYGAQSIDYHSHENKSLMQVIDETAGWKNYSASLFHFSGHADEQALLFSEGKAKVSTICSVLRQIKTRFVFLNGCCTEGFLEALFEETGVVAAIVTNSKVGDQRAANLSIAFYTYFVERQLTLYNSFVCIRDEYLDNVLHQNGLDLIKRNIKKNGNGFPKEDAARFQWNLIYKDPDYHSITINNIQSKGTSTLELIVKEIIEKTAEKKTANDRLYELEKVKDVSAYWLQQYNEQNAKCKSLAIEIGRLEKEQQIEFKKKFYDDEQIVNQKRCEELTKAIKNINYTRQREIYKKGKHSSFACYTMVGDEDALIDLLLLKMEEEYGFQQDNLFSPVINYNSIVGKKFWPALAREVGAKEMDSPEQIIHAMISKYFLYENQKQSKQHIFLKIKFGQIDLNTIPALVYEFWNKIRFVSDEIPVFSDRSNLRHKIFVILIDDVGNEAYNEAMQKMAGSLNIHLASTLTSLPWIDPLQQDELKAWIDYYELDKVGIEPSMAPHIFEESNNGKIRKVLEAVKKRCDIKDLELFDKLKILPDDTQTLFGKNGR